MARKVLLLSAGYGNRLWPLTAVRAKPAVPFLGIPLIRHLATSLIRHGVDRIAVNLHHDPDSIRAALEGIPVKFSLEEDVLGTSGALHPLREFFGGDPFWTVNAKIWTSMMPPGHHPLREKDVLMAIMTPGAHGDPYTRVVLSEDRKIFTGFQPPEYHDGSGYVFTGIQYVTPKIWDYMPSPGFSHFPEVYTRIWDNSMHTAAQILTEPWLEFSTIERYWMNNIEYGGASPEFWGNGVRVEQMDSVTDSVLWNNVTVEAGARVHGSILADGVTIRRGRCVEGAAVVPLWAVENDPRIEILDDNGLFYFDESDLRLSDRPERS